MLGIWYIPLVCAYLSENCNVLGVHNSRTEGVPVDRHGEVVLEDSSLLSVGKAVNFS